MKKLLSLLLVITLAAGILSGCVTKKLNTSQQKKPPTNSGTSSQGSTSNFSSIGMVIAPYDLIKGLTGQESNETILMTLFGWTDGLNYAQYDMVEFMEDGWKKNRYVDKNNTKFGWDTEKNNTTSKYTYNFPNDEMEIQIERELINGIDYVVKILVVNTLIPCSSNITMFLPSDGAAQGVQSLFQTKDSLYEGLHIQESQRTAHVTEYSQGNVLTQFYFNESKLMQEEHYIYSGSDVRYVSKTYNENGNPVSETSTLNGQRDGTYITYFENGKIFKSEEWVNGQMNGEAKQFFENGKLQMITTFVNGEKHGLHAQYYKNDAHQLMITGGYVNNIQEGLWYKYKNDGTLISKIEWENGVPKK